MTDFADLSHDSSFQFINYMYMVIFAEHEDLQAHPRRCVCWPARGSHNSPDPLREVAWIRCGAGPQTEVCG